MSIISLYCGDITTFPTDAIVNAANSSLLGGGGVDGAIHSAAGPELLKACKAFPEQNGKRLRAGLALATPGFKLPARYVIHTVGPIYAVSKREYCAETLCKCYVHSLETARSLGVKTIAFPSISTGVYKYPLVEAAELVGKIFERYLSDSNFEQIAMVAFDSATYNAYNSSFSAVLAPKYYRPRGRAPFASPLP